jgi:alkylation response protein AidB-like acyl-CoA dehydrogenase
VDFLPDPDQDALVEATRDYIDSRFSLLEPSAQHDDLRWKEITELGWLGLATNEDVGGAGATLLDEVFVFREIGRGLVSGPILTTLAAARFASWRGHDALASELTLGQARVARALALPGDGEHVLLLDAEHAAYVLLVEQGCIALYPATDLGSDTRPGLEDGTLVSRVPRSALEGSEVASDDAVTVSKLRRTLSILTSAQLAGIASATKDLATAYAKDREQFGKPIGAFQAIKHKCADMATQALAADNVTFLAALLESTTTTNSDYSALAAASFTRRAAFANARANVQIHGAMGFTVENSAHRFVKRTHTLCVTEGFNRTAELLGALPRDDVSEES